jgi:hypothetical protein
MTFAGTVVESRVATAVVVTAADGLTLCARNFPPTPVTPAEAAHAGRELVTVRTCPDVPRARGVSTPDEEMKKRLPVDTVPLVSPPLGGITPHTGFEFEDVTDRT